MDRLLDLIYLPLTAWEGQARPAFADDLSARYQRVTRDALLDPRGDAEKRFQVRVNASTDLASIPFAALVGPDQDRAGPYGGMSVVLFPSRDGAAPALLGMVVGTNGLAPDEDILGRPGHARKVRAICAWLRSRGLEFAWAKQDPVRIDQKLPKAVAGELPAWKPACDRYGHVLYAVVRPPAVRSRESDALVRDALTAFVDLFFDERQVPRMAGVAQGAEAVRRGWLACALPDTTDEDVLERLRSRRFVILEGPPGTGKTELARRLLEAVYRRNGRVIQFHPGTTYESFIGGLAPREGGAMGFTFTPAAGHLMEAALAARRTDVPYLLVIDEINRADLSKVLGEAIHLFEPGQDDRHVDLPHEFQGIGRTMRLPPNLHVLGTMNSADRSIAILDLAVRRRFAFLPLWPQLRVVEALGGPRMQQAFHDLLSIFLDHATDDAFALLPGHAYFLATDAEAPARLASEVAPLLREYLAQGYVAGFADEIRAWLDAHVR